MPLVLPNREDRPQQSQRLQPQPLHRARAEALHGVLLLRFALACFPRSLGFTGGGLAVRAAVGDEEGLDGEVGGLYDDLVAHGKAGGGEQGVYARDGGGEGGVDFSDAVSVEMMISDSAVYEGKRRHTYAD